MTQDNKLYCTFSWAPEFDEQRTQERYFVVVSVFLIFLPLCVILTLYTLILKELKKGKPLENGAPAVRRQRQREDTAIEKKDCNNSVSFCFVHISSNRVSTSLLFCLGLASVMLNEQIIFSCEIYFLFQCLTKPVRLYHFK